MQAGKLVAVMALAFLFGCTMADEIVLPDGTKGYNISCDGTALSMGDCYQKAGVVCPKGYDMLAQGGEANPMGSSFGQLSGSPSYVQGGYIGQYGMIVTRDLYIRCK